MDDFVLRLGLNEAAAIPIGAIASAGNRWIAWNPHQSFEQNMSEVFSAGGSGALMGAGMAFAFTAGASIVGYAYRTAQGWMVQNQSSDVITVSTPEGQQYQIAPGETAPISAADQLALPESVRMESLDSPAVLGTRRIIYSH